MSRDRFRSWSFVCPEVGLGFGVLCVRVSAQEFSSGAWGLVSGGRFSILSFVCP